MAGKARPERVFSVGHTGGDLSLPEKVRSQVMPSPFPTMDAALHGQDQTSGGGHAGSPQGRPGAESESRRTAESERK